MSEFTERYVRFKEEGNWGVWQNPDDIIEFCLGFDATVTEERIEEELIAASRQARTRVWAQREVAGSFEINPTSARAFYLALGHSVPDAATPYTITVKGTISVPGFTIERGLKGATTTHYHGYYGAKVDRLELLIESEEDITLTIDWAGRNDTVPSYVAWGTITPNTFTVDSGWAYHEACIMWNSSTVNFSRFRMEINNNLEAKFSGLCTSGDPVAHAIREGFQEVTGEIMLSDEALSVNTFLTDLRARSEGTFTVTLGSADKGTIAITLNNIALTEFPDNLDGMSPYDVTIPFIARTSGPGTYDACEVVITSTSHGTITDFPM